MTSSFDKHKSKSIDGCRDCPPRKACEGAEITFEGSGCVEGGGEITLRQPHDETIKFHVDCPGNGKLSIKTCESLEGGGDFYANAKCNEDITLCINNEWLHKFVSSRICNGELQIITTDDMKGGGTFSANQCNNTNIVLGVNWEKFPACNKGGLVLQDGCWRVNLRDVLADAPPVDWDDIINKPKCYPACDIEWDDIKNKPDLSGSGEVSWDDIKDKPKCFPACDGGGSGDQGGGVCINKNDENLVLDKDGCLKFTQPDDPDTDWPIYGTRMFGIIEPDGSKHEGKAKIGFASEGPGGDKCVSINSAGFKSDVGRIASADVGERVTRGNQTVWCVDLKFSKPLKTDKYEVFLTPGDGAYDHIMTYLKDSNAKQGFKVYVHDIENNTSIPGHSDSDSNHVSSFSFMVIF